MKKIIAGLSISLGALMSAGGVASADPAPPPPAPCNAPGGQPCAPPVPLDPAVKCGLIAWMTWTPCNAWGIEVPEGTPGSL